MIKIFGQTDKTFSSNGDVVVLPLKAKVHKEDNGDFYLDLETSLEYVDYLVEGNIVVANTPQGDQAFRVTNPQKTKNKITVKAWHVFYDSKNYVIADSYVVEKNCNDALAHLNNATEPQSEFQTVSNVETVSSYRCVRKSLYEAVREVVDRWGGHLVRDNFTIGISQSIGQDNGVTVRYKKNLKDITCKENWDKVVTKLLPVGRDGLLLNAIDKTASIYVESEKQYSIPYTKTVSFNQDISEDDFKDKDGNTDQAKYKKALVDDLRRQATEYVEQNNVPEVNYTLKANLEKITDIGDTIEVIDERLGIDFMTHVIGFEYDCILKKYTEIEFGNFTQTLSGLISGITTSVEKNTEKQVEDAKAAMSQNLQNATDRILGILGDSYVIFDGEKILVVDRLPKEDAVNVIQINNTGISFSKSGINGSFITLWSIDGNLKADAIVGGTLKLDDATRQEIYNDSTLIGYLDNSGIRINFSDGSFITINQSGLSVTKNGNSVFQITGDQITFFNQLRMIPMTIEENDVVVNDGIGLIIGG